MPGTDQAYRPPAAISLRASYTLSGTDLANAAPRFHTPPAKLVGPAWAPTAGWNPPNCTAKSHSTKPPFLVLTVRGDLCVFCLWLWEFVKDFAALPLAFSRRFRGSVKDFGGPDRHTDIHTH
eukprot:1806296-Rhodomonas_salina.1